MELKTEWTGGHREMVLCLDVSADGHVASGAESGEVCLWSSDGKVISKKTLPSKADVNSVRFSPGQPSLLYLSAGEVVELFDIRSPQSSVAKFAYNKDDINQLDIDPKDAFLAACDDDGIIKVIDIQNRKVMRTFKAHDNICSSVAFHPTSRRVIASGGLDCFVHTWEISRGRPLASVNTQELLLHVPGEDDHTPSQYMINPPFVHSVDFSTDGNFLACGLENARVQLLDRKGKRNLIPGQRLEGHTLGVTQVKFVPNQPGQAQDLLLSAGNDCRLLLWDMASTSNMSKPAETNTVENPRTSAVKGHLRPESTGESFSNDANHSSHKLGKACDNGVTTADSTIKKAPKLCVKHKDKINWIAPVATPGGTNMVLVADVTENISLYQWQ